MQCKASWPGLTQPQPSQWGFNGASVMLTVSQGYVVLISEPGMCVKWAIVDGWIDVYCARLIGCGPLIIITIFNRGFSEHNIVHRLEICVFVTCYVLLFLGCCTKQRPVQWLLPQCCEVHPTTINNTVLASNVNLCSEILNDALVTSDDCLTDNVWSTENTKSNQIVVFHVGMSPSYNDYNIGYTNYA